jgi:hypothetical protein
MLSEGSELGSLGASRVAGSESSMAGFFNGPGEEPHGIALAADLKPVAVVLDFVDPVRAGGHLKARIGTQGRE